MTSYLKESLIFWRHCVQQEVEKKNKQGNKLGHALEL